MQSDEEQIFFEAREDVDFGLESWTQQSDDGSTPAPIDGVKLYVHYENAWWINLLNLSSGEFGPSIHNHTRSVASTRSFHPLEPEAEPAAAALGSLMKPSKLMSGTAA